MLNDEIHHIMQMWEAVGHHDRIVSESYIINKGDVEFNAIFHILQCLSEHCLQVRVLLPLSIYQRKDTPLSNSPYDFCFFGWYTLCYNLCSLIPVQLGDDVQIDSSGLF